MNYFIAVLLDLLTVIIVAVPIIRGFVKGVRRCAFSLLSLVVSAVVAYCASAAFAQPVYERFMQENINNACRTAAEEFDMVSQVSSLLDEYGVEADEGSLKEVLMSAEELPHSVAGLARESGMSEERYDELAEGVKVFLNDNMPAVLDDMIPESASAVSDLRLSDAQIYDLARACAESPEEAAEYTETTYAAPICTSLIRCVLFMLIFAVTSLMMRLAYYIFGFDFSDRAVSAGDRAAGLTLGVVAAAVGMMILCIAVSGAEKACGGLFSIDGLPSKVFLPIFNRLY